MTTDFWIRKAGAQRRAWRQAAFFVLFVAPLGGTAGDFHGEFSWGNGLAITKKLC